MDGSNNTMQKKNKDASATEQEVWLLPCRREIVFVCARARSLCCAVARGAGASAHMCASAPRESVFYLKKKKKTLMGETIKLTRSAELNWSKRNRKYEVIRNTLSSIRELRELLQHRNSFLIRCQIWVVFFVYQNDVVKSLHAGLKDVTTVRCKNKERSSSAR